MISPSICGLWRSDSRVSWFNWLSLRVAYFLVCLMIKKKKRFYFPCNLMCRNSLGPHLKMFFFQRRLEFASVRCLRVSLSLNQFKLKIQGFLSATIVVYIQAPNSLKSRSVIRNKEEEVFFFLLLLLHSELRPSWSCTSIILFYGVGVFLVHSLRVALQCFWLCLWVSALVFYSCWASSFVSHLWEMLTPTLDGSLGLSGHFWGPKNYLTF